MTSYPTVVYAGQVARYLGLRLPLDEETGYAITEAVIAAQSDVQAYLGRPVVPVTCTDNHVPPGRCGWRLAEYPVVSVTSATPETYPDGSPTGLYTVVYVAGLDGAGDPELEPVRRFVKLHAAFDPAVQIAFRQQRPDIATRVTSAGIQGQTASFTDAYPTMTGASMRSPAAVTAQLSLPGALPTLQTLDRWRIAKRRVHQRPQRPGDAAPWPYDMPVEGAGDVWAGRWETWW